MERAPKLFVHLPIDAVDTVVYDPEGHYDPDRHDRYATYTEARNAALSSLELYLDAADYDGDDHREELEQMLALLERAETFEELESQPDYRRFLARLHPAQPAAA
jgi:hypothetical protein